MSAAGPQFIPNAAAGLSGTAVHSSPQKSALARLLHALNQPLTGLQCSLELAVAVPRRPEEYVRTIREGLDLTHRMRDLVDAMREVIDIRESSIRLDQRMVLGDALVEVADELRPVAKGRQIRIAVGCESPATIAGERQFFVALIFRLIESLLSRAKADSEIEVAARPDKGQIQLEIGWIEAAHVQNRQLSHAELGLILVETGCQKLGGRWERRCNGERHSCAMSFPLAAGGADSLSSEDHN